MSVYIAIDMKSFYASVECVARGYDPLQARLLVADESRSDQTICLAVSPALKAIGVPSRPRLFEAKQAIRRWEAMHHTKVDYVVATPRMAEYERVSAHIYSIILRHLSPDDVHVYSIDELFLDCTDYLGPYLARAAAEGVHPARLLAMAILRDVLSSTGITATIGIGTNLYLAKVAMDIVAKKAPADKDGVRIAELCEDSYKFLLWDHRPLTDFWMLGPGKTKTLQDAGLFTMGDVAARSQWDEEWFYKKFGVDAEILIDHAWGIEPVGMRDIKNYRSDTHSLSSGQVLPRPYKFGEARLVFREMIDGLCQDMFTKNLVSPSFSFWVSYDHKSLEAVPNYDGPVVRDFYGRLHPKHAVGRVRTKLPTCSADMVAQALLSAFDKRTDSRLLFRKLGVCADDISVDNGTFQLSFFVDYAALEKEKHLQGAMLAVRRKYGLNAIFKGMSLLEGATQLERNTQIGGHKA